MKIFHWLMAIAVVLMMGQEAKAQVFTSSEGDTFEVRLRLQKSTIMIGEPIFMDFEIKNLSTHALGILDGGDYRNEFGRPESYDIKIIGPDGTALPKKRLMTMGGLVGFRNCAVGSVLPIRLYLPHWGEPTKPGDYRIILKKNLVIRKYDQNNRNFLDRDGFPVEIEENLKVKASDRLSMRSVVDSIGSALISGDNTALKLVPFLNDERIIPYIEGAALTNPSLIRNLSKFTSDRALEIIVRRISDVKDEIRHTVSAALSKSIHPKSKGFLISMRKDSYRGVRLTVLHYLATVKTAESTKMIQEMVDDQDQQMVGPEARRYLAERQNNL